MPDAVTLPTEPSPKLTTRAARANFPTLLRANTAVIILDRNYPRALLIPCSFPTCATIPELKKARTRTLRRLRRIFEQLEREHAR